MSQRYVRVVAVDVLHRGWESLVLYENRFVRLGPLGTHILARTETPQTIEELSAELSCALGVPVRGNLREATSAAVADLVDQGVLREVACD